MLSASPPFDANKSRSSAFRLAITRAALLAAVIAMAGCATAPAGGPAPAGARGPTLQAFASEQELAAYHDELVEEMLSRPLLGSPPPYIPPPPPPPAPGQENLPVADPEPEPAPEAPVRPSYGGPMIRAAGDYLLAVRQGWLASFRVAGGALERVDVADLADPAGPGAEIDGHTNHHELFAAGDDVLVLAHDGASAEAQATFYRRGGDGRLAYRGGWRLRAGSDLHRGSHVARLEGGKLVFYDRRAISLRESERTLSSVLPAVRRIGVAEGAWERTAVPGRVYRPVFPMRYDNDPVLHTVTVCDPHPDEPACRSTAMYAPEGEIVYVSARSAWVWADHHGPIAQEGEDPDGTVLYRLPLDGSAPTALRATGNPRDVYSFHESADGHLNVLLLHDGWTEESRSRPPSFALLRLPVAELGDGRRSAAPARYRLMSDPARLHYNRFVGGWVTYGKRPFGEYATSTALFNEVQPSELGVVALRWAGDDAPAWLPLGLATEAIEPIGGRRALVVATNGENLHLVLVQLGDTSRVAARVPDEGAGFLQGAMRDVAYREDGEDAGLIAVPLGVRPSRYLWRATSLALYRYDAAGLHRLGVIAAREDPSGFGEVKPVFAQGRIFAMMGGELVEAAEEAGGLREVRRVQLP